MTNNGYISVPTEEPGPSCEKGFSEATPVPLPTGPPISRKRNDIQCLRALAIAGVLGFHLRPAIVPQGYLGVDIFFVLSGYLMTAILKFGASRRLTPSLVRQFYWRRLKRLLPTYLFVILATLMACSWFLLSFDFDELRTETSWALAFATNWHTILEKADYFHALSRFKFLLHTWSLGVEVQYYLLAPFLLFLVARAPRPLFVVGGLGMASWMVQIALPDANVAFNFPGTRLWQFLMGTAIFYLDPDTPTQDKTVERGRRRYFLVCAGVVAVVFVPVPSDHWLLAAGMRTLATFLTGAVMLMGPRHSLPSLPVIVSVLTWAGDASYSIYLVHWPVVVLARYLLLLEQYSVLQWLAVILLLSSAVYTLFERPLLRRSSKTIAVVVVTLFGVCLASFFVLPQAISQFNVRSLAVQGNEQVMRECRRVADVRNHFANCTMHTKLPHDTGYRHYWSGICQHEGRGKSGSLLVVGNSFAIYQFQTILDAVSDRFKDVYVMSQSNCMVFLKFNKANWRCDSVLERTIDFLETIRPEAVIITQRLSGISASPVPSPDAVGNDSIALKFGEYLKRYSNFTDRIVLVEPHPTFYGSRLGHYVNHFHAGKPVDDFFISKKQYDDEINPTWFRAVAAADASCPKCRIVPIRDLFCHANDKCDIYDRASMVTYYCDSGHFSSVAVKKFVHRITAHL